MNLSTFPFIISHGPRCHYPEQLLYCYVLFIVIVHDYHVVLTWPICCSSPVSCVCDVYPGLSPSASCLCVVASAATELVVVTPIPGQSLFPFSLCMGRGLSRLSVDTYLINNSRTFIIVSSQNRWLSIR